MCKLSVFRARHSRVSNPSLFPSFREVELSVCLKAVIGGTPNTNNVLQFWFSFPTIV